MDSSDRLPKHLIIGFVLALVGYALFFSLDQYSRVRKGPWQVQFTTNTAGWARIRVSQPTLGVNTAIVFTGERATNTGDVIFNRPQQPIPFGKVKFEDLTYLPGSVAFDFFGHEIELLPRTLYLNKREHPWNERAEHELKPEEKLPASMSYDPRRRKR